MGRGGGRGGAKNRPPPNRDVQVSKKLSWLLRHGAVGEGLQLGPGGYLNLADVLSNRNIRSFKPTFDEIRTLVATNEKQRFSLIHISSAPSEQQPDATAEESSLPAEKDLTGDAANTQIADTDPKNWLIRANQGHSLKVDDAGLLTPITLEAGNLPAVVVHGTRREHWPKIVASGGLKPMGRNHVHFATGLPASLRQAGAEGADEKDEAPVALSGMRATSTVLMFLDLKKALAAGLRFGISENGVVLSEGDKDGLVQLELFAKVEEVGGNVLVKDGQIAGELVGKERKR